MGITIQFRRGTTSEHSSFTGKSGEVTVDTTKNALVVHNGSTVGGFPVAKESHVHADATDSVAGFMSASDKTKLDSISGGTIRYQTVQSNGSDQTQRSKLNLSANFTTTDDGAGNRTSVDLSDSGVSGGTYTKLTVNTKGRVTSATLLSAGDIPNITASKVTDFNSTATALRLDQFTAPTADINVNSNKIINLAEPVSSTDAATKQYVDSTATGLTFKTSCRVASIGSNVNLAAPGSTLDSVTLISGDRVLIKDQSDASKNGIYIFNGSSTPMTRALDADSSDEVKAGMFVLITEGSTNADVGYVLSTDGTIVLGTTNLTFVAFSSGGGTVTAGNGINVTGSTVSVRTVSSSRIAVGAGGVDLATTAVTPGTYGNFTVDAYGRITATTSTSYQTLNSNLTAISGLSATGFSVRTGSGTYSSRTLNPGTGISITNGDGVAGNVSIAVADDTTYQRLKISKNGTLVGTRPELNLIEGTGITLTHADNSGSNRMDVTIEVAGGGGGAPLTSQYVTLATDGFLTGERVLVAGTGLTLTDGGAGNNVTLAFQNDLGSVTSVNTILRIRRGTTSEHSTFAGALAEVTVDTTKKTLVVHDNSTLGGTPLSKEGHTHTTADVSGLRYQTIQVGGTAQTQQPIINLSSLFTASNDVGGTRTTVNLANNNTSGAGTYGTATRSARVTINDQGLITSVSEVTIAGVTPAGTATGDLAGSYPGPTVASVGGETSTNIAAGVALANAATNSATASTIVRRDSSGNFSANIITADIIGNITGNASGTAASFTGNLTGDVTSSGMTTTLATSGVSAGTYGSATQVARVTVDAKGRVTGVTQVTVSGVAPAGGAGGDLNGSYPSPGVALVGGVTAANIASGSLLGLNSTEAPTASTVLRRDGAGSASLTVLYETINVVATSATPTFNLTLGSIQKMTIDAATTISLSGITAGQIVVFDFVHDATTGTFALTWPGNVFGGTANTGSVASKHNVQQFYSDGTNLYALNQMRTDL